MDLVCFRCAASAENDPVGIAIYRAEELLDIILSKTKSDSYRAFLTGSSNFRNSIYPEYKANRTAERPQHLKALREYAVEKMNAEIATDGLEADDMLGIYQTDKTIICSLDKDLLQIKGNHFQWEISGKNWKKPDTFVEQSELEGLRLFYEQCLKGDTSDNIKGISGIGNKKANKLLEECSSEKEMLEVVRHQYGHDDELLMNARCLWILRSLEDDYKHRFESLVDANKTVD